MDYLATALDQAILVGRMHARTEAETQASEDLDESISVDAFTEEDRIRSSMVSKSLAGTIGLSALVLLRQGQEDPVARALALEDYRLRRVAGTEVPNAFSRANYEIDPGEGWGVRWDARLDKGTCKSCEDMNGIVVAAGTAFPDSKVPGDMHPNCRCYPTFVPLSLLKAA